MERHAFSSDRAAGVLLAQACGDALGVPYEFGPALPPEFQPAMVGGGPFGFAAGEYSDDTAMAVCIAEVAKTGADLTSDAALDEIAQRFLAWAAVSKDVGAQTSRVFAHSRDGQTMRDASAAHALANPGRVGNGALMRTSIVGLTRLDDRDHTAASARAVAALTHADPLGLESCVLWSEAVRLAVTEGHLDLTAGLDLVSATRRDQWRAWIDEATNVDSRTFNPNGFTVHALQAAWAAITWTPVPQLDAAAGSFPAQHLAEATRNAVRAGNDTDTVAAIAGGLLGAYWGQSAVPLSWTRVIHGYASPEPGNPDPAGRARPETPDPAGRVRREERAASNETTTPLNRARDLTALAHLVAHRGQTTPQGWPTAARMTSWEYAEAPIITAPLPDDEGVVLGTYRSSLVGVHAIVSLCRIGRDDFAPPGVDPADHVLVRLVDSEETSDNPHLEFVLHEAACTVAALRDEGKRVLLHCVAAQQRTPSVAVAYDRLRGRSANNARVNVRKALPRLRGYGRLWDVAGGGLP